MELSINFCKQIRSLSDIIITSVIFSIVICFFNFYKNFNSLIIILVFYLLFYLLPTIYIYLNYYKNSKNIKFKIDKFGITKNGILYKVENIKEIKFYMTSNKIKNSGLTYFSFECFYFAEINLLSSEKIIITNLFSSKIDDMLKYYFKDTPTTKVRTFYPIVK